jgi:hypothetical protein
MRNPSVEPAIPVVRRAAAAMGDQARVATPGEVATDNCCILQRTC